MSCPPPRKRPARGWARPGQSRSGYGTWLARPGGAWGRTAARRWSRPGRGETPTGVRGMFCKPVAIAPAVVRRDGRVQAQGHPAGHARLGMAEERLDAACGIPDVIGQVAGTVELKGKGKGKARRAMTPALAIRFTLLMRLMGGADYAGGMEALVGDLALVPWQRPYRVPTATVASTWREAIGPGPLQQLRDALLSGIDAEHREHDWRAVTAGDLDTCSR